MYQNKNIRLKIGDKICCKIEFPNRDLSYSIWFSKDKYYIITVFDIETDTIGVMDNDGDRVIFSLLGNRPLHKYFYTEQEMRRFKLNKIYHHDFV